MPSPRPFFCALVAATACATASVAETFDVRLGDSTLGTFTLGGGAGALALSARLSNTPLGVFDGGYEGRSTAEGRARRFTAQSRSSRKTRDVAIRFEGGRATETAVTPEAERTALSDPAAAPAGVIDPVETFARLVRGRDCPGALRFYDGRRAVTLTPAGAAREDGGLTCRMTYRVEAGPAHLKPLGIKSAKIALRYGDGGLRDIRIGSGLFAVDLVRRD